MSNWHILDVVQYLMKGNKTDQGSIKRALHGFNMNFDLHFQVPALLTYAIFSI